MDTIPTPPLLYDSSRGKRTKWKRCTNPYWICFLLSLTPLIRFLISTNYESPFTETDDATVIPDIFHFPIEPLFPFCTRDQSLVMIIVSRPTEFVLRKEIRSSWTHPDVYDTTNTKIWFLVGNTNSPEEDDLLMQESKKFNDIVQVDIMESYYSLSLKTLALLHYKQMRCPQAKCLVKADSDNVLNIRNYEMYCDNNDTPSIVGECGVSRRVIRSASKWAVPFDVYPLPRYPQYCSTGTYFTIGQNTVENLMRTVQSSNFFRSANMRRLPEDVLFTGIFAEMADISRYSIPGLSFFGRPIYDCVNGTYRAYSLHMEKVKEPQHFYRILNVYEGINC